MLTHILFAVYLRTLLLRHRLTQPCYLIGLPSNFAKEVKLWVTFVLAADIPPAPPTPVLVLTPPPEVIFILKKANLATSVNFAATLRLLLAMAPARPAPMVDTCISPRNRNAMYANIAATARPMRARDRAQKARTGSTSTCSPRLSR